MKTAVLVDDTNISDLNYHIMSELNNIIGNTDNDCFLLTNNVSGKVIKSDFAIINSSKVNCIYDGLIIATNISTCRMMLKAATNSKKVLYLYKLDWLETLFDFSELYDVLNHPNLTIICRSQTHADILHKVFNRKVDNIVADFRLEEIWNSLENTKTS